MAVKNAQTTETTKVEDTKVEAVKEQEPKADAVQAPTQKRDILKQIDSNELVAVRNVTRGKLTYVSRKSGMEVHWQEYGDTEFIPFGELLTMKSSSPAFLQNPWCVIDDEQVVEALGLKNLYEKFIPVEELSGFFYLPVEVMEERLKQAPKGTRETVAQYARTNVESGQLDSVRVIKMLERELGIDLLMVQND